LPSHKMVVIVGGGWVGVGGGAGTCACSCVTLFHATLCHGTVLSFRFEKFRWFISSDGLIVVAGSDAQQNEQLVCTRLIPCAVCSGPLVRTWVHADRSGCSLSHVGLQVADSVC
jgi:hypothetical protein